MAANEESDPSVILNGFWVTLAHISKNYFSATLPSTITDNRLFASFFDMNIKHHILFFALSLWSRNTISPNRAK